MNAVLAIDSGGSKCDVLLVSEDGTVLGWGHTQRPGQSGRAFRSISEAIKLAMTVTAFDRLTVASLSEVIPMSLTRMMTADRLAFLSMGEVSAALAQAGVNDGIVALAGTGAFVAGRNHAGKACHFDGMGPYLGDDGGGHHLGLMALRAVMCADWGPKYHTSLKEAVYKLFNAEGPYDLVNLQLYQKDRSEVAQIARLVDQEAVAGDPVAIRILHKGAAALGETMRAVLEALAMGDEPYPLVGIGSVLMRSDIFWDFFQRKALHIAPKLQPMRQEGQAVLGVALAGLAHAKVPDLAASRARLLASAQTFAHYRRR